MRTTNIIMLGSLSRGKYKEYKKLFKSYPEIDFRPLTDFAWNPDAFKEVEHANTYYDNAFLKAKLAHLTAKVPTFSDDSGLEVHALNGKPGVHSHRYATPKDGETQDQANNKKLLDELKSVSKDKRTARFVCTIVFIVEGLILSATGAVDGTILEQPRGNQGFGYDPLFLPNGYTKTFAEMSAEDKNKISHRAMALNHLMSLIKEKNVQLVRP